MEASVADCVAIAKTTKKEKREWQSKGEQRGNDELLEEAIRALLDGCMLFSFGDRADKRLMQIILWLQELREYRNRDAELDEMVECTMKKIDEIDKGKSWYKYHNDADKIQESISNLENRYCERRARQKCTVPLYDD